MTFPIDLIKRLIFICIGISCLIVRFYLNFIYISILFVLEATVMSKSNKENSSPNRLFSYMKSKFSSSSSKSPISRSTENLRETSPQTNGVNDYFQGEKRTSFGNSEMVSSKASATRSVTQWHVSTKSSSPSYRNSMAVSGLENSYVTNAAMFAATNFGSVTTELYEDDKLLSGFNDARIISNRCLEKSKITENQYAITTQPTTRITGINRSTPVGMGMVLQPTMGIAALKVKSPQQQINCQKQSDFVHEIKNFKLRSTGNSVVNITSRESGENEQSNASESNSANTFNEKYKGPAPEAKPRSSLLKNGEEDCSGFTKKKPIPTPRTCKTHPDNFSGDKKEKSPAVQFIETCVDVEVGVDALNTVEMDDKEQSDSSDLDPVPPLPTTPSPSHISSTIQPNDGPVSAISKFCKNSSHVLI